MPPRPGEVHGHAEVAIICLGSEIHGDDAAGLIACRLLRERGIHARIVEAGTDASRAVGLLARGYHVIVVDAVLAPGLEPGTVIVVDDASSLNHPSPPATHGVTLLDLDPSLLEGRFTLVGIVVERVGLGLGVSREAFQGAVRAAQLITELLRGAMRGGGAEDTRDRRQ